MLKLPNGEKLEFLAASGALNYTGNGYWWEQPFRWLKLLRPEEFVVITKTLTFAPRKGNLPTWRSVRLIKGGTLNAVGLTNPGLKYWIDHYYPVSQARLIVSISPNNVGEAVQMARALAGLKIVGIEVNTSCPNVEHTSDAVEIVKAVVRNTVDPVIVKLGWSSYEKVCSALDGQVAAFDLINAVPWKVLRSGVSPLAHLGGGAISGDEICAMSRIALIWAKANLKTPIISGGGINSYEEAMKRFEMGADAISFGTLFLRKPWLPNRIANAYAKNANRPHKKY